MSSYVSSAIESIKKSPLNCREVDDILFMGATASVASLLFTNIHPIAGAVYVVAMVTLSYLSASYLFPYIPKNLRQHRLVGGVICCSTAAYFAAKIVQIAGTTLSIPQMIALPIFSGTVYYGKVLLLGDGSK